MAPVCGSAGSPFFFRRLRFGECRRGCLAFAIVSYYVYTCAAAVNNKSEWGRVGEGMEIDDTLKDRGANTATFQIMRASRNH